jgi:thioesterase domain-containing protein
VQNVLGGSAALAGGLGRYLVADPAEMAAELRAFVTAVLMREEPCQRPRAALEVFNTPVDESLPLAEMIDQVLGHPLNAVAPLIHAAGPVGRPLCLVGGVDGETGWLLRYIRGHPLSRPVYGLLAPAWYGEPTPGSLRTLASRYLRALREAQPTGPYTLGGYSAGGLVALEMAAQLERAGERVDGMLLVDPSASWFQLSIAGVVHFRLNQLRKRRLEVMAPFFSLADHAGEEEVRAAFERMEVPADPISRRFYRGLLTLVGFMCAPPLSLRPIHPDRCVILAGENRQPPADGTQIGGHQASWLIRGPIEVTRIPGPHVRLFEQPALHEAVAKLLRATHQVNSTESSASPRTETS